MKGTIMLVETLQLLNQEQAMVIQQKLQDKTAEVRETKSGTKYLFLHN